MFIVCYFAFAGRGLGTRLHASIYTATGFSPGFNDGVWHAVSLIFTRIARGAEIIYAQYAHAHNAEIIYFTQNAYGAEAIARRPRGRRPGMRK